MAQETKTEVVFVINKGDNVYRFSMPVGAPFGEAYDAVFESLERVQELANKAVNHLKDEKAKAESAEDDKEDASDEACNDCETAAAEE